jgi:FkbM family methyltransferase
MKVKTISAATIFEKYQVDHVDLLQVDTEGFDYEVL